MSDLKWTQSEKKHARKIFDVALTAELAEIMAEFKARAASVATLDDMWAMRNYLSDKQRDIDSRYDFRYSQLIFVFGTLVAQGRLNENDLEGLSEEKRALVRRMAEPVSAPRQQ